MRIGTQSGALVQPRNPYKTAHLTWIMRNSWVCGPVTALVKVPKNEHSGFYNCVSDAVCCTPLYLFKFKPFTEIHSLGS